MRKPTFLFLAVVSLSVPSIGCFDIEEQITVELVSIDTSQAQLAATAIFRDAPIEDGTMVTFRTDHGSFDSEREQTTIDVAASGGRATTTLFRACDLSDATVSVSFRTINRTTPSGQSLIDFPDASPTTNRDLRFTCAAANIAALDEGLTGETLEVGCTLTTPNQAALAPAFAAEAGSFVLTPQQSSTRCVAPEISYRVVVGEDQPQNVAPLPHRCVDELSYPSAGDGRPGLDTYRNPRDGLVTLVVHGQGAEGFTDNNGNGAWDLGEAFDDLSEPYVDANDNNQWDLGEWYLDANNSGSWNAGNGRYDAQTASRLVGRHSESRGQ